MRLIITFFIVILAIAVLFNLGQLLKGGLEKETPSQEQSQEGQVFSESSGLATIVNPNNPNSGINTYITAGPEEGETIEETMVTFEFEAKFPSKEDEGWVFFETKVEGLDEDWKRTSSPKRTITFPPGPKEYTFLVRAKTSNSTDPTSAKRTFKVNLSPYFGKVKISSVRAPYPSYPSAITLRVFLNKEEKINITGWQVKGRRGSALIPQGIKRYLPGYNYADKDIFVEQDDVIYLSGGSNPLGRNRDFRINKCFGYLAKSYNFTTPVSGGCPRPSKDEISHLRVCCQQFILRIGGCEVPDYSNDPRIYEDSRCLSYLEENFDYEGCFRNYFQDKDFLGNSWHIYLKTDIATSDYCDTIYLRDQNDLFVDKYSYGQDVCR